MSGLLKGISIAVGTILGLVIVIGGVFYISGKAKVFEIREVSPPILMAADNTASIARGGHLADILSCRLCHGEKLEGTVFLDIQPFRAVATNLTSGEGGIGRSYSDADWDRAIRYGVKPDGRSMLVMPSNLFHSLSDADALDLISYLKSLPAVDNTLPETEPRMPLFIMAGMPGPGVFPNVRGEDDPRPPAPPVGATREYGAYLASLSCVECHGLSLRGGKVPEEGAPDGPDLAPAGQWPLEAFARALREGQTPYGKELRDQYMPWRQSYVHLNDTEIEALHLYLQALVP